MKNRILSITLCCSFLWSASALAQTENLQAGDQVTVKAVTESKNFAGAEVDLEDFSGIFGMSSDTAYIVTLAGQARVGDLSAKPGEVLVLTPYGGAPVKQIYDASRLLATWSNKNTDADPEILSALKKVNAKQKRGIFFGLFQKTNFNIAAPGSSENELMRRSIVGSDVIQSIRFSNESDPEVIERQVVSAFRDALINGDAQAVASLMDPTPFGGSDMRDGADGARLLMAKRLIESKNWARLLGTDAIERGPGGRLWTLSNGQTRFNIQMRPIGDFTYISSIEQGA